MASFENQGFKDTPPSYSELPQHPYSGPQYQPGYQASAHAHQTTTYGTRSYTDGMGNIIVSHPCHETVTVIVRPMNYTCLAILACVIFFPLGLCALYFALKVKKLADAGLLIEAHRNARITRPLIAFSLIIGLFIIACAIISQINLN